MVTKTICLMRLYELESMKGDEGLKRSIHCSAGDSEEGEEFGQQLMKLNKNPFRYQEDLLIELR